MSIMEMEEKVEKLVSKCYEKDKFIRHVGSVLRGCRCGIVSASLLEELALAESQLEKPDYQQLVSPHASTTSHVRLQGDTISTAWSSLGTISSQLLAKQEQSSQQVSSSLRSSQQLPDTQYVQVAESRAYPVSESAIAASYVEGDLSAPRYVSEVVVTMPQSEQFESRLIVSQIDHQYHGSIAERGDGSTETGQRNLLNNFSELTYENFVDSVSYPPESPESNSEIYTLNNPVITQLLDKPRLDSAHHPDAKMESSFPKSKRKSHKTDIDTKGLKHICKVCGKGYVKLSKLVQHQRSHNGDKPFKCKICKKGFSQGGSLMYHLRVHSGEKPFTCSDCGKKFAQPGHLTSHRLVHMKKFKCDLCPKLFSNESILEQHKKSHTRDRSTKCEHCGEDFECNKNLVMHVRKYCVQLHGIKCQECRRVFDDEEKLGKHKQVHLESKLNQCDKCEKRFTQPAVLEAHKLWCGNDCKMRDGEVLGTKKESLKCEGCGTYFSHLRTLVRHTRRYCLRGSKRKEGRTGDNDCKRGNVEVLGTKKVSLRCEGCGMYFAHRRSLVRHTRKYCQEQTGDNNQGNENQAQVNELECEENAGEKNRDISEEKLKEQQCEMCHKIFLHPGGLETHKLFHFECPECGVFCASFEDLDQHGEEHSRKKPHKCEICLKRFRRPGRLMTHEMSYREGHNKGKPHFPGSLKMICNPRSIKKSSKNTAKKTSIAKGKAKLCIEDTMKERTNIKDIITGKPNLEDCNEAKSDGEEISDSCSSKQENSGQTDSEQHGMIYSKKTHLNRGICPKNFVQPGKHIANKLCHEAQKLAKTSKPKGSKKGKSNVSTIENPDVEDSDEDEPDSLTNRQVQGAVMEEEPDPGVNSTVRTHICEVCGKCFTLKHRLKSHMRVHTGVKPYMCEICGKFFPSNDGLKRHYLSHSGDKKFKCITCNKMFVTSHNLRYHLQVHNHHKEFKCDLCGRSFSYHVNLEQHKQLTHK